MGLFEKLGFERKTCDVCGEKVGLLGGTKLVDGRLCKDCARKVSPHLTSLSRMTLSDYHEHVAYREQNANNLKEFNITHVIGDDNCKLYIDFDRRWFIVSSSSNWRSTNEDILSFDDIVNADMNVKESKTEQKYKDDEGKMVSYNPPRYDYSYSFEVALLLNHPFWTQTNIKINRKKIEDKMSKDYDDEYIYTEEMCEILGMLKSCSREELDETIAYYKDWLDRPIAYDDNYYVEDRNYYNKGDYYAKRDPRAKKYVKKYNF